MDDKANKSSFDERTQDTQPWKEFQAERSHEVSEEAQRAQAELQAKHEAAAQEAGKSEETQTPPQEAEAPKETEQPKEEVNEDDAKQ